MDVTDSLRKHFDLPPRRKAADVTKLDAFLDNPRQYNPERFKPDSLTRSIDFGHSGDIPPWREDLPDRFQETTQVIEKSKDAYFVVESDRLKINAATKTLPQRSKTPPLTLKNYRLRASEYKYVEKMVAEKSDKPFKWDGETLMNPDRRRLLNKIECEVERKRKRDKCFQDRVRKSENLLTRTHPHGVLGIDTPLSADTILYKGQQKVVQNRMDKTYTHRNTRSQILGEKEHVGSGILYHCPQYQHSLKTHEELQHKRRVNRHRPAQTTTQRVFQGKGRHQFGRDETHFVDLSHQS